MLSEYEAQKRHEELLRLAHRNLAIRGTARPPRKQSRELYSAIGVVLLTAVAWALILLTSLATAHV
jgi:hypothetical protein